MSPFDAPWLIIENTRQPGEVITVNAGSSKYALVFTRADLAASFLLGMEDAAELEVGTLESWVLKESFLVAASAVGARAVLFDYAPGGQQAQAADIDRLAEFLRSRAIGGSN